MDKSLQGNTKHETTCFVSMVTLWITKRFPFNNANI